MEKITRTERALWGTLAVMMEADEPVTVYFIASQSDVAVITARRHIAQLTLGGRVSRYSPIAARSVHYVLTKEGRKLLKTYIDRDTKFVNWVVNAYTKCGYTFQEIAQGADISFGTVHRILAGNGVTIRPQGGRRSSTWTKQS